ncbi:MAG: AprI/Inh family metalloprotease inhibitor [Phenylobacterium sp.]
MAATVLLLSACATSPAGARSPALADPKRIAGDWSLVHAAGSCALRLTGKASAQGYRVQPRAACAAPVAQWRPVPEGLELAGSDGRTLMLLVPAGLGVYQGRDAAGRAARLNRR